MWEKSNLFYHLGSIKLGEVWSICETPRRQVCTYRVVYLLDGGPASPNSQQLSWLYVKLKREND